MPEWSNGSGLGPDGLVPAEVQILLSAISLNRIIDWVKRPINLEGLTHNKRFHSQYFRNIFIIESFISEHQKIGDIDKVLTNEKVHELLGD